MAAVPDDLAAEAPFDEERQSPAVIKVGVGEKDAVDGLRIEPKGIRVFGELAASVEHRAIDEDAAVEALGQMAGSRDAPIGAVER